MISVSLFLLPISLCVSVSVRVCVNVCIARAQDAPLADGLGRFSEAVRPSLLSTAAGFGDGAPPPTCCLWFVTGRRGDGADGGWAPTPGPAEPRPGEGADPGPHSLPPPPGPPPLGLLYMPAPAPGLWSPNPPGFCPIVMSHGALVAGDSCAWDAAGQPLATLPDGLPVPHACCFETAG
jgi:hypothetical protein